MRFRRKRSKTSGLRRKRMDTTLKTKRKSERQYKNNEKEYPVLLYMWRCSMYSLLLLHVKDALSSRLDYKFVIQGLAFGTLLRTLGGPLPFHLTASNRYRHNYFTCKFKWLMRHTEIEAPPNRLIHIGFQIGTTQRIKGGKHDYFHFTSDKPHNSFITTADSPYRNTVRVGTTLTVQNSPENMVDNYTGSFQFL